LQIAEFLFFLERFHIEPLKTFTAAGKEVICTRSGGQYRWACAAYNLQDLPAAELIARLATVDPIDEKHALDLVRSLAVHAGMIIDEAERLCGVDDINQARADHRQFMQDILERAQKLSKPLLSVPK
jgi:hypothetical protein